MKQNIINFLDEILNYIKNNHFHTNLIKWSKIDLSPNSKLYNKINSIKDISLFLNKYIFPKLKDNYHSTFRLYDGDKKYSTNHKRKYRKSGFIKYYKHPEQHFSEIPTIKILENNILYIKAPRTWNFSYWNKYFDIINNAMKKWNFYNGIIYDLSKCLGGYYVPIIAPFYQIFGKTIVTHGYNNYNSKQSFTHVLIKGKNNNIHSFIKETKFNKKYLKNKKSKKEVSPIKIGVIVSSYTGSAGEFSTLFFMNRKNVKIFGEKTANMTTLQNLHTLSDKKSTLNIGLAYAIDRNGKKYNNKFYIKPDVTTKKPIEKAIKYILK
jgi:hypothetical protein